MSTFTRNIIPFRQRSAAPWAAGASHTVINAMAGGGKTRALLAALEHCDPALPTLYVTLSRGVVAQVRRQAAGRLLVACTLHQLGRDCLVNALGPILESAAETKYPALCAAWLERQWPALPAARARRWQYLLVQLLRLTRQTLTDPTDPAALRAMAAPLGQIIPRPLYEAVPALLAAGEAQARRGVIDFTDMIYLPLQWSLPTAQYPVVLADEIQELNPAQQAFILQHLAPHGRFLGAGTPRQTILPFNAAGRHAFDQMRTRLRAAEYRLDTDQRCPRSHQLLARRIRPEVRLDRGAPEGQVIYADEAALPVLAGPGDLVVCRWAVPLIEWALKLAAAGLPAVLCSPDLGRQLVELAENVGRAVDHDLNLFVAQLAWYEAYYSAHFEDMPHCRVPFHQLRECCRALRCFGMCESDRSVHDIVQRLQTLRTPTPDSIRLATIHAARGLEADRVLALRYHSLPLSWPGQLVQQREVEHNLLYVLLTRSRSDLILLRSGEQPEPAWAILPAPGSTPVPQG
jgi:hypothetical protein